MSESESMPEGLSDMAPPPADWPETSYARLYLDPGLNHSAGYFPGPETPLAEAQAAKIDRVLRRCRLEPGQRLLDAGCGWGSAALTAASRFGVRVVGITLDSEQHAYAVGARRRSRAGAAVEFRRQDWASFGEPVDRIICVNAFENFADKDAFLPHCRKLLPVGGVIVMVTVTADRPMFRVTSKSRIVESGRRSGFDVDVSESLASHYARTLDHFAANLTRHFAEATRIRAEKDVIRHIEYYRRSAEWLRSGANDMFEFTLVAR